MLSALRHWYLEQKYSVVDMYERTCKELRTYLEVPTWNIVKKGLVASRLSRNVSNIRMQLVENRLWQARITEQSNDIDSYTDGKAIMEHMRKYLKGVTTEPFIGSSEAYEGYLNTLDHIEKISSQRNMLLLGVVAIIAGLVGALIGILID